MICISCILGCTTMARRNAQTDTYAHSVIKTSHLVQHVQRDRIAHVVNNDTQDGVLLLIIWGPTLYHLGCLQCCLGIGVLFKKLGVSTLFKYHQNKSEQMAKHKVQLQVPDLSLIHI